MRTRRHALLLAGPVVAVLFSPMPVAAQDTLADLRRELAALRSEVQQLRDEVTTLKANAPATPAPNLEMVQAQVAELAQTKVESATKFPVRFFGSVHVGVFGNSANANWLDNPNVIGAPPADGRNGTLSASLRQTRLGLASDGPTLGPAKTSAVVAMDFYGGVPAFQTGQAMGLPRMLVAYARVEGPRTAFEAGQDHIILAPRDPTSLANTSFPAMFRSGNLYLRAPQVRVERSLHSRLRGTVGIVAPIGGDFTSVDYLFVPPALGGERSRRPGVQARLAYGASGVDRNEMQTMDIGLSGHVGWERQAGALTRSWATALDFAGRRGVIGAAGEAFVGDHIDAFGGALGLDSRSAGGWAELQLFPSERIVFTTGLGVDRIEAGRAVGLSRRRNQSASSTLTFSLVPEIQTAIEYHWLKTLGPAGAQSNHHIDWVFVHRF